MPDDFDRDAIEERWNCATENVGSLAAQYDSAQDVPTLLARLAEVESERDEARADLTKLKGDRILSVIFGHHKGAPRPFALHRRQDVSGVSGTGVVALGCEFEDGLVVLRWTPDWPTSVVFHERGIESVEAIHGHDGRTVVVWLSDEFEPLAEAEQRNEQLAAENARLRQQLTGVEEERGAIRREWQASYNELARCDYANLQRAWATTMKATAERDLMRPVVEAAKAWHDTLPLLSPGHHLTAERQLFDVVDTYENAQTEPPTSPLSPEQPEVVPATTDGAQAQGEAQGAVDVSWVKFDGDPSADLPWLEKAIEAAWLEYMRMDNLAVVGPDRVRLMLRTALPLIAQGVLLDAADAALEHHHYQSCALDVSTWLRERAARRVTS
jgi:hypothetical protein